MSKTVTISEGEYEMLKGQAEAWEDVYDCIDDLDLKWFCSGDSKTGIELAVSFIKEQYAKAQILDKVYPEWEEDKD